MCNNYLQHQGDAGISPGSHDEVWNPGHDYINRVGFQSNFRCGGVMSVVIANHCILVSHWLVHMSHCLFLGMCPFKA